MARTELPCLVEKKSVQVNTNYESEKENPAPFAWNNVAGHQLVEISSVALKYIYLLFNYLLGGKALYTGTSLKPFNISIFYSNNTPMEVLDREIDYLDIAS